MSIDARALLAQAIEAGLQFGDVISAFHAQQAPVSSAVARYASEDFNEEGVCEIESNAIVSESASGGHYVSAWVWVPDTSLPPPLRLWQEASRQADLDIELPGTGDMLSLEGSTFVLNDEAWDKLLGGTPVEDSTWLLKSAAAGDAFALYVGQVRTLKHDTGTAAYAAEFSGTAPPCGEHAGGQIWVGVKH